MDLTHYKTTLGGLALTVAFYGQQFYPEYNRYWVPLMLVSFLCLGATAADATKVKKQISQVTDLARAARKDAAIARYGVPVSDPEGAEGPGPAGKGAAR